MKKMFLSLAFAAFLGALAACTHPPGQNAYDAEEIGKASDIAFGRIMAVKHVNIMEKNTGAGGLAGATAGGVAGSNVGGGRGSIVGVVAGAILGGLAGSEAERAMRDRVGIQYVIKKENGKIVSIVQNILKDDQPLAVGQRVMIQTSGEYQKASNKGKQGEQYQRVLPVEGDAR